MRRSFISAKMLSFYSMYGWMYSSAWVLGIVAISQRHDTGGWSATLPCLMRKGSKFECTIIKYSDKSDRESTRSALGVNTVHGRVLCPYALVCSTIHVVFPAKVHQTPPSAPRIQKAT
ncbi:hypothetical protein BJX64DRAFT_195924 [Aspergillus heterothallicus]